ncbi:MAG: arsenate reductase (glutaredoxin) [Aurantibacter sp.]
MIKIFHNPRCTKSREGLKILEELGKEFQIVKYLENVPTKKELKEIIKLLGVRPDQLLRKSEPIWKANFKGKTLTDSQIIDAMVAYPKLIERPIAINGNKAVIGRPPQKILEIF